jgi:hypothetical protein
MFASRTTSTVTIGAVVVTIQKLNWKALGQASEAAAPQIEKAAAEARRLVDGLGAEVIAAIEKRRAEKGTADDSEQRRERRYRQYDRAAVLRAGIKSWTAEEKLPGAIDDLEEPVAEQLHRAILDLSLPPIDAAAQEQLRKND